MFAKTGHEFQIPFEIQTEFAGAEGETFLHEQPGARTASFGQFRGPIEKHNNKRFERRSEQQKSPAAVAAAAATTTTTTTAAAAAAATESESGRSYSAFSTAAGSKSKSRFDSNRREKHMRFQLPTKRLLLSSERLSEARG